MARVGSVLFVRIAEFSHLRLPLPAAADHLLNFLGDLVGAGFRTSLPRKNLFAEDLCLQDAHTILFKESVSHAI